MTIRSEDAEVLEDPGDREGERLYGAIASLPLIPSDVVPILKINIISQTT